MDTVSFGVKMQKRRTALPDQGIREEVGAGPRNILSDKMRMGLLETGRCSEPDNNEMQGGR